MPSSRELPLWAIHYFGSCFMVTNYLKKVWKHFFSTLGYFIHVGGSNTANSVIQPQNRFGMPTIASSRKLACSFVQSIVDINHHCSRRTTTALIFVRIESPKCSCSGELDIDFCGNEVVAYPRIMQ